MDFRSKTWIPLLAFALAGCGGKEEPNAGTGNSTAGGEPQRGTESAELPQVDLNDSRELGKLLKSSDIANPPTEGEAAHRGPNEKFESTVFPIYPRGQVRLDGLTAFRLDIDVENFQDGGSLEFHVGKKVLWKQADVFAPKFRTTTGSVPRTVVDSVKIGETVKWGVFYDDPKKKDVVAEFKLVKEDQLDRSLAKLEKDRKFTSQSPLVRTMMKAKVAQNHGLLSEALSGYLAIVDAHPSISEAWRSIVDCMRRLELKNTPLFEEALLQMSSNVGTRRPEDPFVNLPPPGEKVKRAETPITPIKPAMDGDKPTPTPGMESDPAGAAPTDGGGQPGTAAAAYAKANEWYGHAKGLADSAQSEADRLGKAALDANAAVLAAQKALHQAEVKAKALQNGPPAAEKAAADAVIDATKKLMEAQNAADLAGDAAMNAKKIADDAQYTADQANRIRQELQRIAALSGGGVAPMTPPAPGDPKAGLLVAAQTARAAADLAAANAMALKIAVNDAVVAKNKAKALTESHPGNLFFSKLFEKADAAFQAAKAAADAAKIAAEKAEFEAQQALEKAK